MQQGRWRKEPGISQTPVTGRKPDAEKLVPCPALVVAGSGFHLGLAELEGLMGHSGGDVSRKLAICVSEAGEMWEGERAQNRVREG